MVWEVPRLLVVSETGKGNVFLQHPGIPASQAVAWEMGHGEDLPGGTDLQRGPLPEDRIEERNKRGWAGASGAKGGEILGLGQVEEGARMDLLGMVWLRAGEVTAAAVSKGMWWGMPEWRLTQAWAEVVPTN